MEPALAVNLVDAPNPTVDEIWVNVERVVAHGVPGGWVTLITQIRLVVAADGNYVVKGGAGPASRIDSEARGRLASTKRRESIGGS